MSEKLNLGTNISIPMPVALVGTKINGRANFMAVGWVTRVNAAPPMFAIGIHKSHATARGINEHKAFSICFPNTAMKDAADYCGIVSGDKADKSKLFELFYGESEDAPMISECPLNIECRLLQTIELPSNNLYIGEAAGSYSEQKYLNDKGRPDFSAMEPMILTMPDNSYWSFGDNIGKAWKDGLKVKEKINTEY